ncbi:phospholipase D-like domain-containing protein [Emcibacter sp. SYSU 3D8]|uniref:phospholipase D-like domain-containing protein n=1 Tax=Emcibacter sp. SYSU 3D8 TaxID=3133969 RepID=UPI0031FE6F6E
MTQPDPPTDRQAILSPGRNCWRIERASRFALIIDAEAYFRAVKAAMLQARHTIYLIGWDFDTRVPLEPSQGGQEGPAKLGPFLRWLDRNRPDVRVHVLKWDLGLIYALGRGTTPIAVLNWMTSAHVSFKLDGAHPPGAAHHQKIVVVDDALAFCGGIDITADRWDTREHKDDDHRRRRPSGRPYDPWHDATTAVSGDVARALGELARDRWKRATGEDLTPPPPRTPLWPEDLDAVFTDVDVAIARTQPRTEDCEGTFEIETLYLDAIAATRRSFYCESQYFASRRIAEAIAARLGEADGPEFVIVNPESADGFLESATMDSARARLLAMVRKADIHDRFRLYTPVTEARQPIYVHAKVLVADDRLLRVGSSNLNNRSMGFDTECDLIVEAAADDAERRDSIAAIRDDLLAEHLGTDCANVREALARHGGRLTAMLDELIGKGRSLVPYQPEESNFVEETMAENVLLDPERPPRFLRRLRQRLGFNHRNFR